MLDNDLIFKYKVLGGLFSEQAKKTPEATALIYQDRSITYFDLDAISNQLGHYLQGLGIGIDHLVPICMEQSPELIIGILGILKAGGAYVPLDPEYPLERKRYLLTDTAATVVLTSRATSGVLPVIEGIKLVEIDGIAAEIIRSVSSETVYSNVRPSSLAYVLYTSGTTGKPKGVLVEHSNVVSLVKGTQYIESDQCSILLSTGSVSFDATTFEYWSTLLNGGQLILCTRNTLLNAGLLKQEIRSLKVNKMWFTSSWLNQLIDDDIHIFENIKMIIAGGEKLSEPHIEKLLTNYPELIIINGYGPTENTTFSLTYHITKVERGHSIPIGKPLSNRSVYILDSYQHLLPKGVVGEIYLGGAGLARGYLNQPELTKEKFINHPFRSGERLYRTGDQGRWLPDGNIEFLGRIDDQLKIRGYRIEPREIEAALYESGMVRQAVVLAREDTLGTEKQLLGYVVAAEGYNREQLQSYLQDTLPEYMVPKLFMELDSFPLTSNGKVDKKSLPEINASDRYQKNYEAPQNELEELLITIWQDLLFVRQVSIHDNFFNLGGDSIKVIRLVSKLRKALNYNIEIFEVYQAKSLKELALIIKSHQGHASKTKVIDAVTEGIHRLKADVLNTIPLSDDIEDVYPMSDIQNGMIYSSLISPGNGIYHDQCVFKLSVPINQDIFENALSLMVNKHSMLRTGFNLNFAKGIAIVYKAININFNMFAYDHLEGDVFTDKLNKFLNNELKRPFEIDQAPLWRAAIFNSAKDSTFVFQFHHAILDGWSLASFATELNNTYVSLLHGEKLQHLEQLKSTYKDAIISAIVHKDTHQHSSFWKNELDEYKRLDLFDDKIVNERASGSYEHDDLEKLSQRLEKDHISIKAVFLGAFISALNLLTYQNEITIGLVTNTRPASEDGDKILGCFLNTIPFRFKFDSHLTWKELFLAVEEKLLGLKGNDATTLFDINRLVEPHSSGVNPFFDVIFNFTNFHIYNDLNNELFSKEETEKSFEIAIEESSGSFLTNTFLDFNIQISPNRLSLGCLLTRQLKNGKHLNDIHESVTRIIGHYLNFPDSDINSIDIIENQDVNRLMRRFNAEIAKYPDEETLITLFRNQALQYPDAVALVFGDQQMSYAELDKRSNQLGNYLQDIGVGLETLVPICIDRSLEMIIGILGILKAGAAYVPIDPEYPMERMRYLLADTGAKVVLSHRKTSSSLPVLPAVILVELDGFSAEGIQSFATEAVNSGITSSNLAYVIYTSGSTGQPKGVLVEHRSVVNLICHQQHFFGIEKEEQILQFSNYTFDASVEQIFLALLSGSTLVLIPRTLLLEPALFENLLHSGQISHLHATPSFLEYISPGHYRHLKRVIAGGESCKKSLAASWAPYCKFYNEYGPTEATVTSVVYPYQETAADETMAIVAIGKPLSNTPVYILDQQQQLLPIGVPGELYIGGIQVARGYLNQAALSQEKFLSNPFQKGGRIYRSGDLCCWLADGNLRFLGRIDDQVKIQGYRIEPGEIESAMYNSGLVEQAVVVAREATTGIAPQLLGYVVAGTGYSQDGLRSYLHQHLPVYMVPGILVELDNLPLTANGKIDKQSLQAIDFGELPMQGYQAPRNELEASLVMIWQDLLDLKEIGVHADFFEIGGHSLLATRVVSAIRKNLKIELPISTIFKNSTIAMLADTISLNRENNIEQTAPYLSEHLIRLCYSGKKESIFIIPGSDGISDGYEELANEFAPLYDVYGLKMIGLNAGEIPLTSIESIASYHIKLIREIQPIGPYRLIGHSFGGIVLYEMIKQLDRASQFTDFTFILDQGISLKKIDLSNEGWMCKIIAVISKLLAEHNFTTELYPAWLNDLKPDLIALEPVKMIPVIERAAEKNIGPINENLNYLFRLLKLQVCNDSISYQPEGYINTEAHIILAAENKNIIGEHKGWSKYFAKVHCGVVPGNHYTMIKGAGARAIAKFLNKQ